ncbi:MAG: efflux transporter periplasmic adaptor subunit [Ignavibacteriae bacterium HGW-Ignavibacteriae-3]|nr:MAG: efflux transporter periplasmic adaptor subunit [Ignavibacteriae bacterium HGW-Ignavibacteriae-3]
MNSKTIKKISIAGFVIVIIGFLVIPRFCSKKEIEGGETAAGRRGGTAMIAVNVRIAKPASFENKLQISGSVISNEEVELRMETSGKIIAINFKEGTRVNKGDLLVKVNDADLQAQLQKVEIRKKLAEDKEFRQRTLLEKKGISQESYDVVLNDLNSAKADIENLRALIAKTEIHAPFNGTIGLRYVSEGSYVSSSTKIATLQNINPVKIDFSIPQRYAGIISVGNKISVKSPSGKIYQASIYAIEPKVDPATRALKVRAICPNERRELIPGSYVGITLALNDVKNAITIPTQALALDISGERVFIYKNGLAIAKKVESGIRTEEEVQIVDGIATGDSIIVSGIMQLRPRAKVRILNIENK